MENYTEETGLRWRKSHINIWKCECLKWEIIIHGNKFQLKKISNLIKLTNSNVLLLSHSLANAEKDTYRKLWI